MRFGSLFSGIGGIDLGLEWAGLECAWQVENDPYAVRVLEKHWPDVKRYGDIREVDFGRVEPVELLAGGFPCQDVSLVGRGEGIKGARSGLWSEYVRAIRALRPRYVLVENVPGLLSRGMDAVLGELALCGYDAEWQSLPAAAFGAPHLRWRVFLVAYPRSEGRWQDARGASSDEGAYEGRSSEDNHFAATCSEGGRAGSLAYADNSRRDERAGQLREVRRSESSDRRADVPNSESGGRGARRSRRPPRFDTRLRPAQEIFAHPDSEQMGRATEPRQECGFWAVEPDVGRVAHGVPSRVDRLRGLGNAVVPQVAEWIGRRILDFDQEAA